jgi:2,3-dihydro-2,3-dihydroxybenzoate dehydrogenase
MSSPDLRGKVALVTGAGRGIGAAIAQRLADRGASVAAVDRDSAGIEALAARAVESGSVIAAFGADVSNSATVTRLVREVERQLGLIDLLVNVAGVLRTGPVESCTDEDWAEVFSVNTTGVFFMSRAVIGTMTARRSGCIITVGSNAAGVPRMHMAAYAASKAAATLFTKCLGLELAQYGVRCNVVSPGSTDTPMQRSLWADGNAAQAVINGNPDAFRVGIPLGKLASCANVADAVMFLASDAADHITMHDLYVDGGAALRA